MGRRILLDLEELVCREVVVGDARVEERSRAHAAVVSCRSSLGGCRRVPAKPRVLPVVDRDPPAAAGPTAPACPGAAPRLEEAVALQDTRAHPDGSAGAAAAFIPDAARSVGGDDTVQSQRSGDIEPDRATSRAPAVVAVVGPAAGAQVHRGFAGAVHAASVRPRAIRTAETAVAAAGASSRIRCRPRASRPRSRDCRSHGPQVPLAVCGDHGPGLDGRVAGANRHALAGPHTFDLLRRTVRAPGDDRRVATNREGTGELERRAARHRKGRGAVQIERLGVEQQTRLDALRPGIQMELAERVIAVHRQRRAADDERTIVVRRVAIGDHGVQRQQPSREDVVRFARSAVRVLVHGNAVGVEDVGTDRQRVSRGARQPRQIDLVTILAKLANIVRNDRRAHPIGHDEVINGERSVLHRTRERHLDQLERLTDAARTHDIHHSQRRPIVAERQHRAARITGLGRRLGGVVHRDQLLGQRRPPFFGAGSGRSHRRCLDGCKRAVACADIGSKTGRRELDRRVRGCLNNCLAGGRQVEKSAHARGDVVLLIAPSRGLVPELRFVRRRRLPAAQGGIRSRHNGRESLTGE